PLRRCVPSGHRGPPDPMNPTLFRGYTFLIVDDDPAILGVLSELLGAMGASVHLAANGYNGLQQLERWHPDVVLCDLAMPTMSGLEFAQRMRLDPDFRSTPLIAVTGQLQVDLMAAQRAGFDAHVLKPITLDALNGIAQRLPGGRSDSPGS